MTRKTAVVTITDEGRDKGKVYFLREMSAYHTEKWGWRAFLAMARSGVEVPDDIVASGIAGIAALGLKALIRVSFADAEPLMDEMFECIKFMPDPRNNPEFVRPLVEDDTEEVWTRLQLRAEVFNLHVNFSIPGFQSKSILGTTEPGS